MPTDLQILCSLALALSFSVKNPKSTLNGLRSHLQPLKVQYHDFAVISTATKETCCIIICNLH